MFKPISVFCCLIGACCVTAPLYAQAPQPKELGEVRVQGVRDPDLQAQQESTSTKIIYGRDKLDQAADATAEEFIKRLPGITVSGTPGEIGRAHV